MASLKILLTKLKNQSVYKLFLNNYFLIAFLLLLVLLSIINIICSIFLVIYIIYLVKLSKPLTNAGIILGVVIFIHFLWLENSYSYDNLSVIRGEVIEISPIGDGKKLTIKDSYKKYIVYDYNNISIDYGDIVEVSGKALAADSNRVKNGFNYKEYLKNSRIFGTILSTKIKVVDKKFNLGIVKNYFEKYLEKYFSDESKIFLRAMIIGDLDDIDEQFKNAIMNNGILHLFAVSGLHIVLFIGLIEKALKFFNLKESKIELISSIFLIIYLILTNFSPSVLRASLMYYIALINKKLKLGLSTLDVVSIIFILLVMFNPLYIYNLGFSLSFISSTIIVLVGDLFKKYSKYIQVLIMSIFANLVTFPLVININGKINALSPISNVIFIELVETIILPISFLILVFPIFNILYEYIIVAFNKITLVFSKYFLIDLRFPYLNSFSIIIYFLILFILIKVYHLRKVRYSLIASILITLFIFSNSVSVFKKTEIHFLDLANGEASLIIDTNNQCTALIDTGDGTNNEVTSYLKKEGIKKLDYLIITHNHFDHNGEVNNILNEINVNNLVFSAYDISVTNNFLSKEEFANVIKVKAGDEIVCGKSTFYILHPDKYYNNENENSIVIYTKVGGLHFLFLGDATKAIDKLITNYNISVDVIKIAHHGSSTSSSAYLIEKFRPKYAVIMTGRVEKFGFPHEPVIDILNDNNVVTYRTDIDYSIIYKYYKNRSIFETIK